MYELMDEFVLAVLVKFIYKSDYSTSSNSSLCAYARANSCDLLSTQYKRSAVRTILLN